MAGADHNRWLNMGSEMISYPKKVRVKGGEGWVKGQRHPSPLTTPVFIGVSGEKVKGEG